MAVGKSLADSVPESEIINLGEEINPPNILIDDNFGINGMFGDYALVKKGTSYRTGKEEDGINQGKVIRYTKWAVVETWCYGSTIFDILKNYTKYNNLCKTKALKKCKDFNEIEKIYIETNNTINNFLSNYTDMNKKQSSMSELINSMNVLKKKLDEANKVLEEVDDLHELVKKKRRIIVKDTEPTKHRNKKEKE